MSTLSLLHLRVFVPLWLIALCVLCGAGSLRILAAQGQPVPQPFPRGGSQPAQPPKTTTPAPQPAPSTPASAAAKPAPGQREAAPTETMLGVPIYPTAQFIASYDAGRGQRYYLFGAAGSFADLVSYYRTVLKQRGELVYEVPGTYEFDVGKFDEDRMAFPPGVTIKDFQSDVSGGYPNPKPGAQPARFPTIIQIVPVVSAK